MSCWIFADMFYMGVSRSSTGGTRSLLSGGSGAGVSLMKADRRKSTRSTSETLLNRSIPKRMSRVGTFGP